jgi:hypothetical protein
LNAGQAVAVGSDHFGSILLKHWFAWTTDRLTLATIDFCALGSDLETQKNSVARTAETKYETSSGDPRFSTE